MPPKETISLLFLLLVREALEKDVNERFFIIADIDRIMKDIGEDVFDIVAACAEAQIELYEATAYSPS